MANIKIKTLDFVTFPQTLNNEKTPVTVTLTKKETSENVWYEIREELKDGVLIGSETIWTSEAGAWERMDSVVEAYRSV